MTFIFLLLRNIRNWLASRAESKRIRVIKEALKIYAIRRRISQNNKQAE